MSLWEGAEKKSTVGRERERVSKRHKKITGEFWNRQCPPKTELIVMGH